MRIVAAYRIFLKWEIIIVEYFNVVDEIGYRSLEVYYHELLSPITQKPRIFKLVKNGYWIQFFQELYFQENPNYDNLKKYESYQLYGYPGNYFDVDDPKIEYQLRLLSRKEINLNDGLERIQNEEDQLW